MGKNDVRKRKGRITKLVPVSVFEGRVMKPQLYEQFCEEIQLFLVSGAFCEISE